MFSSTEGEEDLKKILLENLDWTQEMEFEFLNERLQKIVRGLCDEQSSWIYTASINSKKKNQVKKYYIPRIAMFIQSGPTLVSS